MARDIPFCHSEMLRCEIFFLHPLLDPDLNIFRMLSNVKLNGTFLKILNCLCFFLFISANLSQSRDAFYCYSEISRTQSACVRLLHGGDCAARDCTGTTLRRNVLGNRRTQLDVIGKLICLMTLITWCWFNLCFISPVWLPFGQISVCLCVWGVAERWRLLVINDSLTIHYVFLGPKLTSPWPSILQPPTVSQLMHTHAHTHIIIQL